VEIPAVIGLPLGQAESQLSAKGLEMRTQQAWSEDTPGQVIDQDPPAGSLVDGGSAVSLVVSSGTRVPVGARLGDGVLLVAYELPRLDYRSGETLPITLVWQCFQKQKEAYKVFVHLTQADGSIVSQQDGVPVNGSQPTDSWIPGNQVVDQHELNIPPGTQPGEYWLRTGMYNADGRMPVTDAGRISTEGDVLVLSQILVN
jgi:hypothetical protein